MILTSNTVLVYAIRMLALFGEGHTVTANTATVPSNAGTTHQPQILEAQKSF